MTTGGVAGMSGVAGASPPSLATVLGFTTGGPGAAGDGRGSGTGNENGRTKGTKTASTGGKIGETVSEDGFRKRNTNTTSVGIKTSLRKTTNN